MRNFHILFGILFTGSLAACATEGGDDADTSTRVSGIGQYRDAETDHDGDAQQAAAPAPQDAMIEVVVRGQGELPELEPQCTLEASGEFQARYSGVATVDEDGVYLASLTAADGRVETLGGCELPDLTVALISDVVIRVELDATVENCQTYCASSARADAEAACGADAEDAACRGDAEAEAEAACTTTCTTDDVAIAAESSLGASAVGSLDADALHAAALGELTANLTFDRLD